MTSAPPAPPVAREQLIDVARRSGTPTYVYDESILRRQSQRLQEMVRGIPTKLLYAIKANYNPGLLRILQDEGFGFDAVSPAEATLVSRLGTPPSDVLYSANNMSDAEMRWAVERDLLLNIGELSRLRKFGESFPDRNVCIRVNPDIGAGHHEHVITAGKNAKFGIPVTKIPEIHRIVDRHNLGVIGLHQHIGSGILDVETLWRAMEVLLEAANAFPGVQFINFGGGLGIPYAPGDHHLDPDEVRETIVAPLREYHDDRSRPVTFWFEPGRYLVAECGVLVTRVTTLKPTETRTFAGTDTGLNHLLRPALYDAYHHIYNLSNPRGSLHPYDITGNICESGDLFARNRPIQEIREGDLLAIHDVGAYGMSMSSYYNLRTLPAEVLISSDGSYQTLRRRLGPEELLDHLGFLETVREL